MAGKPRVHELAKELGVASKDVLNKLKELGEFVKSASSTVEAPVARRVRESFPAPSAPSAPAAAAEVPNESAPVATPKAPKKVVPKPPAVKTAPASAAEVEAKSAEKRAAQIKASQKATAQAADQAAAQRDKTSEPVQQPSTPVVGTRAPAGQTPVTPAVVEPTAAKNTSSGQTKSAPRPGPRPGNNPFGVGAGKPVTPAKPQGTPRPSTNIGGNTGGGGNRPSPGMIPGRPAPGQRSGANGNQRGSRSGSNGPGAGRNSSGPGSRGGSTTAGSRPGSGGPSGPGGGRGRSGAPGSGSPASSSPRPGGGGGRGGGGRVGNIPPAPTSGPPPAGGGRGGRGGRGGPSSGATGAFGRGTSRGGPGGRGRKSKKQRKQEFDNLAAPTLSSGIPRGNGEIVRLPRGASLADFADKINLNPAALVQEAFGLGEMVTATQSCSDELLQLLGVHLGYDAHIVSPEDEDRELLAQFDLQFNGDYSHIEFHDRPPVVTVMGHVDHGKTKLLDAIRHTDVVSGEAGGITQHIGAYQVTHRHDDRERKITFIDTPGHEAFTAMRARGAQVTDIAILVVAADDGVKPQTVEALNHAKAAGVPVVVAVNKIDKDGANPDRVRQQLTDYGLVAEEYGGDTMFVNISAKQRLHLDELLEAVLLTADASLELKAPVAVQAQGVAIEAHLDRGRGPVASVLIQRGTLRIGDSVVAGEAFGRVRALQDEHGVNILEAGPSRPVQVLGFTSVPRAGDNFLVVSEDRIARQIAEQRATRERNAQMAAQRGRPTLETIFDKLKEGEKTQLALIVKADVSGAVEALQDALSKLDVGADVELRIIHRGVGAITENDVMLASAFGAVILGFNVRPEGKVRELADREHVDMRYYSVIYQAIDDIESALKGLLKPEYEEIQTGTAEIREVFRSSKFGNIAGTLVRSGIIRRNSKARLIRDGAVVAENLAVGSLRRFKDDATEVREGYECGIGLGAFNDIKVDDVIETYELQEKPR